MKSKKCCFVLLFFKLLVTKLIRANSGKMMSKEEGMMASTHNRGVDRSRVTSRDNMS